MNTNKYSLKIVGVCFLLFTIFCHKSLCQSYSVIDLDKVVLKELPGKQKGKLILDGIPSFNSVIRIKAKSIIPFLTNQHKTLPIPVISNGTISLKLSENFIYYDLESATLISNSNRISQDRYSVFKIGKQVPTKSLFGNSYNVIDFLVSVDKILGDTLWMKQGEYLLIYQANSVSYITNRKGENFIIDNKTGKELIKLNSLKTLNVYGIKEDDEYLYLISSSASKSELIAINLSKKDVVWKVIGDFNKIFIDENRIYTSNQYSINKRTGEVVWNNSNAIQIVCVVNNYLIGYLDGVEDDSELFVFNKESGELIGYLWTDSLFCKSCFGFEACNPHFVFADKGYEDKIAAIIECTDGTYLYVFEAASADVDVLSVRNLKRY